MAFRVRSSHGRSLIKLRSNTLGELQDESGQNVPAIEDSGAVDNLHSAPAMWIVAVSRCGSIHQTKGTRIRSYSACLRPDVASLVGRRIHFDDQIGTYGEISPLGDRMEHPIAGDERDVWGDNCVGIGFDQEACLCNAYISQPMFANEAMQLQIDIA